MPNKQEPSNRPSVLNDPLLDSKALADLLHVSVNSISLMHTTGTIPPGSRVGRKYVWRTSDIEQWLETNRKKQ